MSEQATGIVSPDGQSQWDGVSWQPISQASTALMSTTVTPNRPRSTPTTGTRRKIVFGALGLVVLGVAASALFLKTPGVSPAAKAIKACQRYSLENFAAPATTRYRPDATVTHPAGGGLFVEGHADSQNEFGALVEVWYSCNETDTFVVTDGNTLG